MQFDLVVGGCHHGAVLGSMAVADFGDACSCMHSAIKCLWIGKSMHCSWYVLQEVQEGVG